MRTQRAFEKQDKQYEMRFWPKILMKNLLEPNYHTQCRFCIVVGKKIRVEDNLRPYFLSVLRRMDVAGIRNES